MAEGAESIYWLHILAAAAGYLLGSIPFGLVLTRAAGLGDVRKIGSGNIGATNVLRTGNKGLAAATLILDGAKGAAAVLIMGQLGGEWAGENAMIAGLFSIIGHNFPVWLGFRGGKGVATTLGVLLAVSWPVGLLACLTWLLAAALFRYSSLAAIVSLSASPFYMFFMAGGSEAGLALSMALLSIARHHQNIARLIKGEESKIGGGKK